MTQAATPPPADKALTTLTARCCLHGFCLTRQPNGAFFVGKWGYGCELPDEAAVEAWLERAASAGRDS